MPYRKQDNVAFDTKMILSVFFMSCGERQKKRYVDTMKAKRHSASHTDRRPLLQECPHPPYTEKNTKCIYTFFSYNVFIFLGFLCRKTEAIAKGSGGNK